VAVGGAAGAAFVFHRLPRVGDAALCANADADGAPGACAWTSQGRLQPSHAVHDGAFGAAVATDSQRGWVVVGAPRFHTDDDWLAPGVDLACEAPAFALAPGGLSLASVAHTTTARDLALSSQAAATGSGASPAAPPVRPSGAAFVFAWEPEKRDGAPVQQLLAPARWSQRLEAARVLAPHARGGEAFGAAVALAHGTAVVAAPGDDHAAAAAGSLWAFDARIARVSFDAENATSPRVLSPLLGAVPRSTHVAALGLETRAFLVVENATIGTRAGAPRHHRAVVPVHRHGLLFDELVVDFHTRDLTARGVTPAVAARCRLLPRAARAAAGCGDYVATHGQLRFAVGQARADIVLELVDDACAEPHADALELRLAVPGGVAPASAAHRAVVLILDDDSGRDEEGGDADPLCA
jgi:hypothetical protein